tara:strand:- start:302 stop:571 length:270 start_codon:yes stop_codon:yes gene_type:complete
MILASCSTLSGFAPEKGATGEEFLIQKKNALVMPPDYNDLPVPSSKGTSSIDNSEKVISLLGIKSTTTSESNTENKTLENSILKKIKNN